MQDHNHSEFNAEFMDASWEKMRQQLDVELPVENQRRRGMWWWWTGLAAGILIGIVAMWLFVFSNQVSICNLPIDAQASSIKENTTQKQVKIDPNIVEIETPTIIDNTAISSSNSSGKPSLNTTDINDLNQASTPEISIVEQNRRNKTLNNMASVEDNKVPIEEMEQLTIGNQIGIANEEALAPNATRLDNTNSTSKTPVESIPLLDRTTIDNFSFLPYLNIQILESLNSLNESVTLPQLPVEVAQRSRFHFSLHAGVNGNQSFNQLGYVGGVGIQWQSKRKWGWTAGVQYAQRSISNQTVQVRSEAILVEVGIYEEDPDEDTGLPQGGGSSVAGDTVIITSTIDTTYATTLPNVKYNFYELPVQLTYQIRPRWAVGVGARLGYRIEDRQGDLLSLDAETDSNARGAASNDELFSNIEYTYINNEYQFSRLKSWQVAPTASIRYRLTPRLNIQAQYALSQWIETGGDAQKEFIISPNNDLLDLSPNKKRGIHEWQLTIHYLFK